MLEDCKIFTDSIQIRKKIKINQNIRKKVKMYKNKVVFLRGRKIRSVDLAQLSSLGLKKVDVYKNKSWNFLYW